MELPCFLELGVRGATMMNHRSSQRLRVLLIDSDEPLGQAIAHELRQAGHHVKTHSRHRHAQVDLHADDLAQVIDSVIAVDGPFDRVIFGMTSAIERFDTPDDIYCVQQDLSRILGELQAVARAMARGEDGQIWMMIPEDSMHYYTQVPCQPVRSKALMAAVKSMAKELFRFGLQINALQVQPLSEQLPPDSWSRARSGLKAYALKFKPRPCADAARFIHSLLAQPHLPLVGLVLPLGIGFPEGNA